MFDSNSIYAESELVKMILNLLKLNMEILLCWNFNKCLHGNHINKTGLTRVSFDFRILPMSKYKSENINHFSASVNKQYW